MNFTEAMNIAAELRGFLALMQSPDARWDAAQDWLRKNPRWRAKINHYVTITPDAAVQDLKQFICEQTGAPASLLATVVTPATEAQARSAIETLQTLYRERASLNNQPKKLRKGKSSNARRVNKT